MSSFSLGEKQISVNRSDLLAVKPLRLRFLTALNTSSWKVFWSKGDSSHFENSPSSQISWTYSDVVQINEKFIHNCPPCSLAEMAKVASSVARPWQCYINRLERFIYRHIRNRLTNQIAGNSLFSSEIILNRDSREFKKATTATATGTSSNKRFNEDGGRERPRLKFKTYIPNLTLRSIFHLEIVWIVRNKLNDLRISRDS